MLATLPAVLMGFYYYGMPAVGVVCLAVSSAIMWELVMNLATRNPITIGDGNAALIGLLLAMLLPATLVGRNHRHLYRGGHRQANLWRDRQ